MTEKKLEITKVDNIVAGEIVELPPFYDGTPFNARLRRPSLLSLCAKGVIPNELLKEAQDIYKGKDLEEGRIKEYGDVLIKVAEVALIEPKYSEIADYITDLQLVVIYNYTQTGVSILKPFREIRKLQEAIDRSKQDRKTDKPTSKD